MRSLLIKTEIRTFILETNMSITIEQLRTEHPDWILMESVVGSQSFGLATPTSDIDLKGVFVIPMDQRISYGYYDQIADEMNNEVYWELSKFIQLIQNANPGALEFLFSSDTCITIGKEYFEYFRSLPVNYANMKCKNTFLGYAVGQISRARGLNKKIVNPQPKEPPQVLDFCYILEDKGAVPVKEWLKTRNQDQKWYALAAVDHFDMGYHVYQEIPLENPTEPEHTWRWAYGIVSDEIKAKDVQLVSIPKGIKPVAFMTFNRNAFSKACKTHTEYWHWEAIRNEERYNTTMQHGQGYDAKNCMHCIRLLMTALDIATTSTITVDRTKDREYLLSIKAGKYTYEEIMAKTDELSKQVSEAFDKSSLPELPYERITPDEILLGVLRRLPAKFSAI